MKRIISIVLSLVLIFSMTAFSFADDIENTSNANSNGVKNVIVNGKTINFDDVKPEINNGRTMVPIRKIGEIMNAAVAWRTLDRTVHIFRDGKCAILEIGSSNIKLLSFECVHNLKYTSLDTGKDIILEAPPYIINGRTFVPLRAIANAFGLSDDCISWDGTTRTATITDSAYASYQVGDEEEDAADLIENWNYVPADYVVEITDVYLNVADKSAKEYKDKDGTYYYLGGNGLQLDCSVLPNTADKKNIEYKSSNESVATVDENGFVTRVSKGEAEITAVVSGSDIVSKPIRVKAK